MDDHDWTYIDALRVIWERSGYDRGFVSDPFWGDEAAARGLRRTAALLERLGNPHERYPVIHVAGSKGKGSTCAFAASILREAGYRVGLHTSPHLHTFRERIAVDGLPISEAAFAALTVLALRAVQDLETGEPALGQVTAFELLTVMALTHFATAGCDAAVVEVGMGGGLDATNVVTPEAAVITALDLEHTRVLGTTLAEIAGHKAGIIKPGRPVVVTPRDSHALEVITAVAVARQSPVLLIGRDWRVEGHWTNFTAFGPWGHYDRLASGLAGHHQRDNAGAALAAAWLLDRPRNWVDAASVRQGLGNIDWPGRFERLVVDETLLVVLDGAHTAAAGARLTETFRDLFPSRQAVAVVGVMSDKDPLAVARPLAPVVRHWVATQARSPRALSAERVGRAVNQLSDEVAIRPGVAAAIAYARDQVGSTDILLVTGSLATVAEAREALGLAAADPPVT